MEISTSRKMTLFDLPGKELNSWQYAFALASKNKS
jgi:hypothetical protein